MKYNAVKHAIETDAGRVVARLEESVTTEMGYRLADLWEADDVEEGRSGASGPTRRVIEAARREMVDALSAATRAVETAVDAAGKMNGTLERSGL